MNQKKIAGEKATEYIKDGMVVGLGTGSTAFYMIKKVGEMVSQGLNIKAVATSKSTENLANELNIPLISIDEVEEIDLVIDGVDEIDRSFNAIKGGGGALFREKIVANLAKRVIWIMDDSKLVDAIGNYPLPVEILPFGYTHILKKLNDYNFNPVLRKIDGNTFITDNGNYIIDLHLDKPMDINNVSQILNSITGVLEVGLFINTCERIIIGTDNQVKIIENLSERSKGKDMNIENFWNDFLNKTNRDKNTNYIDCFHFELTESLANELLELVLIGQKKATASSLLYFKIKGEAIPKVGDLNIVTNWNGEPKCVIETTNVTIIPFKDMTYDICKQEGEDDDLESWRRGHIKFFTNEGKALGYNFTEDMPVVFENFEVVYKINS